MKKRTVTLLFIGIVLVLLVFDLSGGRSWSVLKKGVALLSGDTSLDIGHGRWLLDHHVMGVSFLKDTSMHLTVGRIVKEADKDAPRPMFQMCRPVFISDTSKVEIQKISDVVGHVWIDTPEKALEFVRVFASVHRSFDMEESAFFWPVFVGHPETTITGAHIIEEEAKSIGYFYPEARKTSVGFEVGRFVVDYKNKTGDILKVTEGVTFDGVYSIVSVTIVKKGVVKNWGMIA